MKFETIMRHATASTSGGSTSKLGGEKKPTTDCAGSKKEMRCVVFNLKPVVKIVPNRSDYTTKEASKIWYTSKEKRRMLEAVQHANQFLSLADERSRGLEMYLYESCFTSSENRRRVVRCVLRQQAKQKSYPGGVTNNNADEILRAVSVSASRGSSEEAIKRGRQDAELVYLMQMKKVFASTKNPVKFAEHLVSGWSHRLQGIYGGFGCVSSAQLQSTY